MNDCDIVEGFLKRDESAIAAAREKYGRYCQKIAYNITGDIGDCEEVVNDVLLGAWNSIPPQNPEDLRAYLVKLTRRSSIDILRSKGRQKRRSNEYAVSLSELCESLPDGNTPEHEVDLRLLTETLNNWLKGLPTEKRTVFLARYYFSDPVADISKRLGYSIPKTKSLLRRLRLSLKKHLEKENIL